MANSKGEMTKLEEPHVRLDLCTGCGNCESNCPTPGCAETRVLHPRNAAMTEEMAR